MGALQQAPMHSWAGCARAGLLVHVVRAGSDPVGLGLGLRLSSYKFPSEAMLLGMDLTLYGPIFIQFCLKWETSEVAKNARSKPPARIVGAFPSLSLTEFLGVAEACFLPTSQGTSPWAEQALRSLQACWS